MGSLAAHPQQEREPEVRVRDETALRAVRSDREGPLELIDGAPEAHERPTRPRDADRSAHPQIEVRVVRGHQLERARERVDRLARRESL